jgi:tRNA(adenine34) deaminase
MSDINRELDGIANYLASRLPRLKPHTAEEYFTLLLGRAIRAARAGDYGISAALVVHDENMELITFGTNNMVSAHDPFGHAEANAIRAFQRFMALSEADRRAQATRWRDSVSIVHPDSGSVFLRSAPQPLTAGARLYATLEPCPMCTVAIINSGIQRVTIAIPDALGGVLAQERLGRLPEVWPQLAASQHLRVEFANSGPPEHEETYISPELSANLSKVFWETKASRDAEVSRGVLFSSDLPSSMRQILRGLREGLL